MRVQRIRIERVANADGPSKFRGQLPGVPRVEIEIQKAARVISGQRESLRRNGGNSIDELRQRRITDRGNRAFSEIVVVEAKDSRIRSKPEFVSAVAPGKIVVEKNPRDAPSLLPSVVKSSDRGERSVRPASLQYDRKRGQRLLEITRREKALVPRKSRIEIIHQVL